LNQVATKLPVHHWRQGLESSCLQLPSSLVNAQA
jgi:hypothetical protein